MQLEMFSRCAQFKNHPDSEHFKHSYCCVFENGFKFRGIFCLRVLNVANFLKSRNLILEKVSKNKGWFLGRGTLFTRNMCYLVRIRHITRDVCFVGREHITGDMCFLGRGACIAMDMCFLGRGTQMTRDMFFLGSGTHFTRDRIFLGRGTLFTRDMCFPGRGGLQESIFPKRSNP